MPPRQWVQTPVRGGLEPGTKRPTIRNTVEHYGNARSVRRKGNGNHFLGADADLPDSTALSIFCHGETYNSETFGDGDLLIGSNSASKPNLFWDASTGVLAFRVATASRVTIGTDGSVLVGDSANENVYVTGTAIQLRDGSTVYTELAAGVVTVGRTGANQGNVQISAGAVSVRLNTTERIGLTSAGVLTIKDSGGAAVFTFDASAGAEFTKPLTIGTSGGIYQGTGSFATPTTGLKVWNDGGIGRIAGYNGGTIQVYVDTDGKLYAGAGGVKADAAGITITTDSSLAGGKLLFYNATDAQNRAGVSVYRGAAEADDALFLYQFARDGSEHVFASFGSDTAFVFSGSPKHYRFGPTQARLPADVLSFRHYPGTDVATQTTSYLSGTSTGIGIGTIAPAGVLHVHSDSTSDSYFQRSSADASAPRLILRKSRGSESALAAVTTGDDLGHLAVYGRDSNSAWIEAARLHVDSFGTIGTSRVPSTVAVMTLEDAATPTLTTRALFRTEGLFPGNQTTNYIAADATGIGINDTTPSHLLDVNGTFRAVGAATFDAALTATGGATTLDSLQCNSITNDTGLAAGTYTPTLAGSTSTNIAASGAFQCQYLRVGNTVTVSGLLTIDPTSASVTTAISITLPVSSNIGSIEDLAGVAASYQVASYSAAIYGDSANDCAILQFVCGTDVASRSWMFTFTYQVI